MKRDKIASHSEDLDLLIVEDEEIVARMLVRTLRGLWRTVSVARSSSEGLDMILHNRYDVVLTDWDCPNDGEGILIVEKSGLPVVVQTGNLNAVVPVGVNVLHKPVDKLVLTQALVDEWKNEWKTLNPDV